MKKISVAALLLATAAPLTAQDTPGSEPVWAFETSDIAPDPAFVFGRLANGMRYIVRQNDRPEGTALVRLHVGSGSLSENENERGLAHFLEHMAFNGSRRIPEGEMIKLLEREGLAFGADTNATTGFEATTYKLDLPRADADLLDTALMIMRETASELTLDPEAIDRERGVVLSERRDRNTFGLKNVIDSIAFQTPDARYGNRLPIGVEEVLRNADAATFRAFYEREYVPANTTLVIVGDFAPDVMQAAVEKHFASWQGAADPAEPVTGPVALDRAGETDIYLDPSLNEQVSITRFRRWEDRPDTQATRRESLLRSIGYAIVNRRLARLARQEDAPFLAAGFGSNDLFEDARTTSLTVNTADGGWDTGMEAAAQTVRTALAFGFSDGELNEQLARTRTALENAVAAADTRTNAALTGAALALVQNETIPTAPADRLAHFEEQVSEITLESVLAAVQADIAPLDDPLVRFVGRTLPDGGEAALRQKWNAIAATPVQAAEQREVAAFAYTDFGAPGVVVSDTVDNRLDIRTLVFDNGVRLNLKRTDLSADRISYRMNLDGGRLLATRDNPDVLAPTRFVARGGLGEHSQDELATILAGRSVGFDIRPANETFIASGTTTPRDLELQLQLLAAALTDPGYRAEGETLYRRQVENFYQSLAATPGAAYRNAIGAILSDDDPRFSLTPEPVAAAQSYETLRTVLDDRLATGAIELALVGDMDEDAAIELVAKTLGALPAREPAFQRREANRDRTFTTDRTTRTVYHDGEADQAAVWFIWPTTDDSDLERLVTLQLLARVARIELLDELRERLGQAYSPGADHSASRTYPDYGTFTLGSAVDLETLADARAAIMAVVERLRSEPVPLDRFERARRPSIEAYDNALKTNGGWMTLVDRAQSKPEDIARFQAARDILTELTPDAVQSVAQQYLTGEGALEVQVVPRPAKSE